MTTEATSPPAETWAILELMGHVRLGGRLSEEEKFGVKMGRLDVPTNDPCGAESDNWCPKCGRCSCPNPDQSRDHPSCPLHAPTSRHATAPKFATQFFGGASVYRITIVSEEVARAVATQQPAPVSAWELPKRLSAAAPSGITTNDDDPDYDRDANDYDPE